MQQCDLIPWSVFASGKSESCSILPSFPPPLFKGGSPAFQDQHLVGILACKGRGRKRSLLLWTEIPTIHRSPWWDSTPHLHISKSGGGGDSRNTSTRSSTSRLKFCLKSLVYNHSTIQASVIPHRRLRMDKNQNYMLHDGPSMHNPSKCLLNTNR